MTNNFFNDKKNVYIGIQADNSYIGTLNMGGNAKDEILKNKYRLEIGKEIQGKKKEVAIKILNKIKDIAVKKEDYIKASIAKSYLELFN